MIEQVVLSNETKVYVALAYFGISPTSVEEKFRTINNLLERDHLDLDDLYDHLRMMFVEDFVEILKELGFDAMEPLAFNKLAFCAVTLKMRHARMISPSVN